MPVIPLPTGTNPVQDVPGAVLDRERRPAVNNSGVIRATGELADKSKMPDLPMSLAAPWGALGRIGQAIAETGDVMGAAAAQQRRAETRIQIDRGESEMKVALTNFEAWRADNPDPLQWEGKWQTGVEPLRRSILDNPNLNPAARDELAARFDTWGAQTSAEVTRMTRVALNSEVKKADLSLLSDAMHEQNPEKFGQVLKSSPYIPEYEKSHYQRQYDEIGRQQKRRSEADLFDSAENEVITLARGFGREEAMAHIDELPGIDAKAKERLRATAAQASNAQAADAIASVADMMARGEVTSEARVEELLADNPNVPPAVLQKVKDNLERQNLQNDERDRLLNGERNFVELGHRIDLIQHGKVSEEEYANVVMEVTRRVPSELRGELLGPLYQKKVGALPKVEARPEIQQNTSRKIREVFDPFRGAIPWKSKVTVKESGKTREEERIDTLAQIRAFDAQTKVEIQMNDWFKANPNATVQEASQQLNKLLPEGTRAGVLEQVRRKEINAPRSTSSMEGMPQFGGSVEGGLNLYDFEDK